MASPRIERLPLFPLPNVVLFPRAQVPLHVFEARYRQMTEDALAGDRRIGMIAVRPEHLGELAGDPPLFSIGCAGEIERFRRYDDGRFDVLLRGTERFRIVEEPPREPPRPYRVARVALLDERFDAAREEIPLQGLRADAVDLLVRLVQLVAPESAHELDPRRFSGIDDLTFVDLLCQMLALPVAEKQGLLEADGPLARCERAVALLQFRVAERSGGIEPPRTVH